MSKTPEELAKEIVYKTPVPIEIDKQMESSYLEYSMSVIVGRALPDARDGLKPVHRRILHAMNELGITSNSKYKKCARIVGDVIGKYHPHGDTSVYDALVRMAQDFSLRVPLIEGQGNFGSMDGDSAAAMRYTEARFGKITDYMIKDLDKETVDILPNYDDTLTEPNVLPTRIPNLLLNGSSGIAVGMSTNIPPHNLNELLNATIHLIDNPNAILDDLMQFIQGPDFPTGGEILGKQGIRNAYETGQGRFKIRAKVKIEEKKGREAIIVEEIPYQVNKANLYEKINELGKDKIIEGMSEIRDESNRDGVRLVIELKKDAIADIVLNNLYKHTNLETTFSINFLAILNKEPKVFTLIELLNVFINHRKSVVIRRTIFELNKAKAKLHILDGLIIALNDIDNVIKIIKNSENSSSAKVSLIEKYALSEIQVSSILDMKLSKLTSLEIQNLEEQIKEIKETIKELELILSDNLKLNEIIKDELKEILEKFNSPRLTKISDNYEDYDIEDLIPNEPMVVTLTQKGYIKRVNLKKYEKQKRGGKGKVAVTTYEDDDIKDFFVCNTHDNLLCVTDKGNLYQMKVYRIPEFDRNAKGKAIVNLVNLKKDEKIVSTLFVNDMINKEGKSIIFLTKKGIIKRTSLMEFGKSKNIGVKAINLDEGDYLIDTKIATDEIKEIFVLTRNGISIRFPITQLHEIGRSTRGVRAVKFKSENDYTIGFEIINSEDDQILTMSERGIGKKTTIQAYRSQSRGGKGIIAMKLNEKTGLMAGSLKISKEEEDNTDMLIISEQGKIIRVGVNTIKPTGRSTMGVKLINLEDNIIVTNITKSHIDKDFIEDENNEENE